MSGFNGGGTWWRTIGPFAIEMKCANCGRKFKTEFQEKRLGGQGVISFSCPDYECSQAYQYNWKSRNLTIVK